MQFSYIWMLILMQKLKNVTILMQQLNVKLFLLKIFAFLMLQMMCQKMKFSESFSTKKQMMWISMLIYSMKKCCKRCKHCLRCLNWCNKWLLWYKKNVNIAIIANIVDANIAILFDVLILIFELIKYCLTANIQKHVEKYWQCLWYAFSLNLNS